MINDIEIGERLCKLRKTKDLTQGKLFDKLQSIINGTKDEFKTKSDYGKQNICKLEKGVTHLNYEMAIAYAKFFNVSLDYLYFGTESYKPEYDIIKKTLGFSDDAIHKLEELNTEFHNNITYVLNELLDPSRASYFIELLQAFFDFRYVGYESDNEEYLSLFKINEIARKIANEFKNIGVRPWK